MKCVCGLDHSKPLPDRYKNPPVVLAGGDNHEPTYYCHVCDGKGKIPTHKNDCDYIKKEGK
jgi:hypothetical protein